MRIATLLLLAAAMSTAQAQDEGRAVIGPTDFSCGRWTNSAKDLHLQEVLKHWVLGYLSGANMERVANDFLRGRDVDGLTAWIDNYCRSNPIFPLMVAHAPVRSVALTASLLLVWMQVARHGSMVIA